MTSLKTALLASTILFSAISAKAQTYDIIAGFGQSNSTQVGYGAYSDPMQLATIDSRIKQLSRFEYPPFQIIQAVDAEGEKLESWNNISPTKHGFLVPFARRYVNYRLPAGRDVLILSAGRGGASILDWNSKLFAYPESRLLFSDMMGKLRWLLSIPGNRLISINISLGETDVGFYERGGQDMTPEKCVEEWSLLLSRLTTAFPGVPIVSTKFAPQWNPGSPYKIAIEACIKSTTESFGGKTVETTGLLSNIGVPPAEVHFSAQAMQQLGARHWVAWASIPESSVFKKQRR